MIINLSFNSKLVSRIVSNKPDVPVFDFTGVLGTGNKNVSQAREIDRNGEVENEAFESYITEVGRYSKVGKLNGKCIRDISIKDITLFWLTGFAEKHDSYHWGQTVFYFLTYLKKYPELFSTKLEIILFGNGYTNISCKKYLEANILPSLKFSFLNQENRKLSFVFVKKYLSYSIRGCFHLLGTITKSQNQSGILSSESEVFITNVNKWYVSKEYDRDLEWVKGNRGMYINLSWSPFSKEINSDKIFNVPKPNLNQFVWIQLLIFKKFIQISFVKSKNFLTYEILEVLQNFSLWYGYIGFSKLSNSVPNSINFYFSDEFYKTGRVISSVIANQDRHNSNGVQHGLIMRNHSVYHLSEAELSGQNSLPCVDKFIIWEGLFKKYLLRFNRSLGNIIDVYNNQYYTWKFQGDTYKSNIGNKTRQLLWCTTTLEHFNKELEIIRPSIAQGVNLIIRLHPGNYISIEDIQEKIKGIEYEISTHSDLKDDFNEVDLVITNAFSTIFYDAVKYGIPVVRIIHGMARPDFVGEFEMLFDVRSKKEFEKCLGF